MTFDRDRGDAARRDDPTWLRQQLVDLAQHMISGDTSPREIIGHLVSIAGGKPWRLGVRR